MFSLRLSVAGIKMDIIRFIEPKIERLFDKIYYGSCIVKNKLHISVGDCVAVKTGSSDANIAYGKIMSLYDDESIRTMNNAGSTLSPFKGEIIWYFTYKELPSIVKHKIDEEDAYIGLYVPLISLGSLIPHSLETIELKTLAKSYKVSFKPLKEYQNTCYLKTAFDIHGNFLDAKKTLENSMTFSKNFLLAVNEVLSEAYKTNKRHQLLRTNFKIDHWFDSRMITLVRPKLKKIALSSSQKAETTSVAKITPPATNKSLQNPSSAQTRQNGNSLTTDNTSVNKRKKTVANDSLEKAKKESHSDSANESFASAVVNMPLQKNASFKTSPSASFISPIEETKSLKRVKEKSVQSVSKHSSPQVLKKSDALQHRQFEFEMIDNFIKNCINNKSSGCLYISGLPGSGKTATLQRVLKKFRTDPDMIEVYLNCASYTNSKQVLVDLAQKVGGCKVSAKLATNLLDTLYSNKRDKFTLLSVDEFDHLCTSDQHVWYNICEWTTRETSKFIFIALANTIDLPERLLSKQTSSRFGFKRLFFNPYNFMELADIIGNEMSNDFESDALKLISRRIAAVSGDVRRCLSVCRKAREITDKKHLTKVTTHEVEEVFNSLLTPADSLVSTLPSLAKTVLRALVKIYKINSSDHPVSMDTVYDEVSKIFTSNKENLPSLDNVLKATNTLIKSGLVEQDTKPNLYSCLKPCNQNIDIIL